MIRCHKCSGSMESTTGTFKGRWTCPKCLYEIETGKKAVPAPKKQRGLAQR